jgi:ACS family hexuronate transporter-like MFS transporter
LRDEGENVQTTEESTGAMESRHQGIAWWKNQFGEMCRNYRWRICALLFFATTINYIDRNLFGNLVPILEDDLKLGPTDIAFLNSCFQLMYGFGMIFVGRFVDHVGTKRGLSVTFSLWNLAAMGHALANSVPSMAGMRIALAAGEGGNFPAAIKTVAEWFPRKERALATGLFNCGTNIGAVLAPFAVYLAVISGWRECFVILGALGFIWLFFWHRMYSAPEVHPKVSPEELAYIKSDPPDKVQSVHYVTLFQQKQLWGIGISRMFSDGPWWLYLTWTPKFLVDKFHLGATAYPVCIAIIYLIADFGAIGGGWISTHLIKKGKSVNYARKFALLCCACGVAPVVFVGPLQNVPSFAGIPSLWLAVGLIALAASSHQGWSSNMFTAVSDTLPKSAVAMTVGVGSAFGAVGAALLQFVIGKSVAASNNYSLPFLMAGCTYFVAWGVFHYFVPRMEMAEIDDSRKPRFGAPWIWAGGVALLAALALLQVELMRPPFQSENDYLVKQAAKLKAGSYAFGPTAKVGWKDGKWVGWRLTDGTTKLELIVFDRAGRPAVQAYKDSDVKNGKLFIEKKKLRPEDGDNKYEGPSMDEVNQALTQARWDSPPSPKPTSMRLAPTG